MLDRLNNLVSSLKKTSGTLEKKKILSSYDQDDVKQILFYTYNPLYQYFVTSEVCEKNKDIRNFSHKSIIDLLDDLRLRKITGHDAVGCVNSFVDKNIKYKDLILSIIDKDLKTRTAEKIINSVFDNLIPEFEVALADKYDEKNVSFKDTWYASHKLDGVRCICVIDENGKVEFFSRQGKLFSTLSALEKEITGLNLKNVVFDGELCIIKDGKEDFQSIMKLIRRKDYTIQNPVYKLFDCLSLNDFLSKKSKEVLADRFKHLGQLIPKNNKYLHILEQTVVKDSQHLKQLLDNAIHNNWEGLMLRKNTIYRGKRSKDLLKCKTFSDAEYKVVDVENGKIRVVEDGKEKEETMLSCVTIKHKGYDVRVGSGWSIEDRRLYFKHPEKILGKTITVKYFEETKNQDGGISLRFPVFKCLHEEGERNT